MVPDSSPPLEPLHESERQRLMAALQEMSRAEEAGAAWPGPGSAWAGESRPEVLDALERYGLIRLGETAGFGFITNVGWAFLAANGVVDRHVLGFFARHIDDLPMRAALLRKSRSLIDRFVQASARGGLRDHVALNFIPRPYQEAIDEVIAARFFAAASAVVVRIANDEPAHCLAENIVLAALHGAVWDEVDADPDLGDEEKNWAKDVLEYVWHPEDGREELDALFDPAAPVDLEAVVTWFDPMPGASPIGHLGRRPATERLPGERTTAGTGRGHLRAVEDPAGAGGAE